MNTTDRLNKIANKGREIVDAQKAEQLRKEEIINCYARHIKNIAPRIKELMKVGHALLNNNLAFGKQTKALIGYDEEFITNGITHKLGFFFQFARDNSPLLGIGIKGGGCCGQDLAVDENGDMVVKIDPHYHSYRYFGFDDYCGKCEQFLDDFNDFEKRVYEYIDNL